MQLEYFYYTLLSLLQAQYIAVKLASVYASHTLFNPSVLVLVLAEVGGGGHRRSNHCSDAGGGWRRRRREQLFVRPPTFYSYKRINTHN